MPPQKRESFGLLDTVIVLLISSMAILLLLWLATTLAGRSTAFEAIPDWLQKAASSLWTYLTASAGAGALLLKRLSSQKGAATRLPNYLLAILLTTASGIALVFAVVFAIVKIVPSPGAGAGPGTGPVPNSPFALHFVLNLKDKNDNYPQLAMIQQRPVAVGPIGIAPLRVGEDFVYKTQISWLKPGEEFGAIVHRSFMEGSQKGTNYYIPDWTICFLRRMQDPQDGIRNTFAFLKCDEGKGCVVREKDGDPGWATSCPSTVNFIPVVHAQGKPPAASKEGWLVPSLATLKKLGQEKGISYTSFQIKSEPRSDLSPEDVYTYQITVNGFPVAVDGWRSDVLRMPVGASRSLDLSFGLENLDFSGADNGCENIEVRFHLIRKTGNQQEFTLYRKYAALRNPTPVTIRAPDGISYAWTGQFTSPRVERKNEVFVASTSDARYAALLKSRIDQAALKFDGKELTGVIRPPLDPADANYGVVVALREPSGQVHFTFDKSEATALVKWVTASQTSRAARTAFPKPVFVYSMRGESSTNPKVCTESGYRP